MIKEISALLLDGYNVERTCIMIGISSASFCRWRELGKTFNEGIFYDFYQELQRVNDVLEKQHQERDNRLLQRQIEQLKQRHSNTVSRPVKLV